MSYPACERFATWTVEAFYSLMGVLKDKGLLVPGHVALVLLL